MARHDPRHPSPAQVSAALAELREKVEQLDGTADFQRLCVHNLEARISNNETRNMYLFLGICLGLVTYRKLKGAIPA